MKKNKTDRDIVLMLTMTLITLVSWLGFEVYLAYAIKPVPDVLARQLMELNPNLDTITLDKIEKRQP